MHFESEHAIQGKKYDAELLVYYSLSPAMSGDELKNLYSDQLSLN